MKIAPSHPLTFSRSAVCSRFISLSSHYHATRISFMTRPLLTATFHSTSRSLLRHNYPSCDSQNTPTETSGSGGGSRKTLRDKLMKYENIYTIPNMLSATRLLLSPYIGYLLVAQQNYALAFGAFAVAGFTDLLDGWIARRYNSRTVLGSVLDPLADKTLMTVLTVSLSANELLPLPLAGLILLRDAGLIVGASYYRYISLPQPRSIQRYFDASLPTVNIRPSIISKVNTALQLLLMGCTLATPALMINSATWQMALQWMQYAVGGTTILSGASYIVSKDTIQILRDRRRQRKLTQKQRQ